MAAASTGARRVARTAELIQEYEISGTGPGTRAGALSGGNQQKLVVARELSRAPAVIVAENPTRGLDIRAATAIHARLRSAAAAGPQSSSIPPTWMKSSTWRTGSSW